MIATRRAQPDDAAAILAIVRDLISEPGVNVPLAPDEFTRTLDDQREALVELATSPRTAMFVATVDGVIVGQISIKPVSQRRALLHVGTLGMSVVPAWRGRGVGAALMTALLAWTPGAGYTRVELAVYVRNTAAVALYKKFGFQIEGTRRNCIREGATYVDDYTMARLE